MKSKISLCSFTSLNLDSNSPLSSSKTFTNSVTIVSSLTPTITLLCPTQRAAVESEMVELQTKDILKVELRAGVGHFWSLVSEEDFPTLKPLVQKVMSFFVSTYTCESTFSTMNTIKRKQRNHLTNEHLECLTRIATTSYKYNMKKVKEMHAYFRSSQH